MPHLSEFMIGEHHRCDDEFAQSENAVSAGDWASAAKAFARFRTDTETHFSKEEEQLFPAIEEATGMKGGPTQVMRLEHAQMRDLLAQLGDAAVKQDGPEYLGLSETLLMVMQQHNHKEEFILYPIADEALGAEAGPLLERLQRA